MKRLMLTAAACAAMTFGARADISVDELTKNLPANWGYATEGLGTKGDEVALVFTNTSYTSGMSFTLPDFVHEVRYLVVGGGGAGGSSGNAYAGGGGGAGGVVQNETPLVLAGGETVTAVVGVGSPKVSGDAHGGNGDKSTLTIGGTTFTAYRGAGGGAGNVNCKGYGNNADSMKTDCGGGAGANYGSYEGGVGFISNGGSGSNQNGGGGGGAGGNGYDYNAAINASMGGPGVATTIFDDTECYIAGGGSGCRSTWTTVEGPIGGGGFGNRHNGTYGTKIDAGDGTIWGAGGGGGGNSAKSGAGHQGVVVVRFSTTASSTVPVQVPVIASKAYTGETLTADVEDTDAYEVTKNEGGVNAGTYDVVLHLKEHEPAYAWQDDGSTEDRTLPFVITKVVDSWATVPSLSKLSWGDNETPAEVFPGAAKSGAEVQVTYDDGEKDMPLTRGNHTAVFTVAESQNYTGLSEEIDYTVLKHVNSWTIAPNVPATVNIEDGANFTTPVPAHGTLVCYYDGNRETVVAPLTLGKHTVTYFVEGDGVDWEDFEQTYGYEVTYKPVVDPDDPSVVYGYRLPKLGEGGSEVAVVFTNTAAGAMTFKLPKYVKEISYLIVGGGASGGRSASAHAAGGGGAGGVVTNEGPYAVEGGTVIKVAVGAGGAAVAGDGKNGNRGWPSSLAIAEQTFVALRGGYGGCYTVNGNGEGGSDVACGGGAGGYNNNKRTGGDGVISDGADSTGGGAGGGGAGGDASGANGGVGVPVTIFDDTAYYIAGGGAGSGRAEASQGGLGGGGNGGSRNGAYWNEAATSGTRWGAGGGGTSGAGCQPSGAGHQGVVVIRYAEAANAATLPTIPAVMYTGEPQVAKLVGGTGFTVVANEGGTDAGTNKVTIALAEGYTVWEDGVTDTQRTLDFVIEKADHNEWNPEPSVSKSMWTVGGYPGVLTAGRTTFGPVTATYTRNGEDMGPFGGELPEDAGVYVIAYVAPEETDNYVTVAEEDKVKTVAFTIVDANAVARIGDYDTYGTVAEAFAAAGNGDEITILQNATVVGKIDVTNSVKLVLAGNALTVGAEGQGTLFQVKNGATLTIDGTEEGSTLNGSVYVGAAGNDNCALVIDGGTYNCAKVEGGTVVNPHANCAIQSNGLCENITITATGATFNSADDTFYLAAGGTYTLADCVVNGATGIYMKGGALNLTGTTITANGAFADPLPNGNGAGSTGDGIIVDAKQGYTGNVTLNLGEGNVVTSVNGYAIRETYTDADNTAVHAILVTGGTFAGAKGTFVASAFFDAALAAGTATCAFEKASYTKPLDTKYIAAGHLQKKLEDGTYCIGPAADTEALTYTWTGAEDANLWQAANWSINKELAPDAYVGFPNSYDLATAVFPAGDAPVEVKLTDDVSVKALKHVANAPAVTIDLNGHTLAHNLSESSYGGGVGWQYFTLRAQSDRGSLTFKNGTLALPSGGMSTGELLLDANSHVYFDNVRLPTSGKDIGATYQHKDVAVTFQNGCQVAGLSCYGGEDFLLEVDNSTVQIDPQCGRSKNARLVVRNGGRLTTSGGAFNYGGSGVTIQVEGEGSTAQLTQSSYPGNGFTGKDWTIAALDGAEVSMLNIAQTFTSDPSAYDNGTRFVVSNAAFRATGSAAFNFGIHTTDATCVSPTIALAGTNANFRTTAAFVFGTDAGLENPPMFELNPAANGLRNPCITSDANSITIGSNVRVRVVSSGILASGGSRAKVTLARVKASGTLSVDVDALAANTTIVDAAGEKEGQFSAKYALKDVTVGDVEYKDFVVTVSRGGFALIIR